jgi:hypothetical protein
MDQIRAQGTIPVTFEHNLKSFNERWEIVTKLIDDKKHKASLARQRRDVVDLSTKVETSLKDVERFVDRLSGTPDNEYEIKAQLDQCKVMEDFKSSFLLSFLPSINFFSIFLNSFILSCFLICFSLAN